MKLSETNMSYWGHFGMCLAFAGIQFLHGFTTVTHAAFPEWSRPMRWKASLDKAEKAILS